MAEHGARSIRTPAEDGPRHQAMEILEVQLLEHLFEVVAVPLRMLNPFPAADLANQIEAAADIAAVEVTPVAIVTDRRNRAAKEFREQDFRKRFHHGFGGAGQRIGHANVKQAILPADLSVGVGVAAELNADGGNRSPRTHLVKDAGEDLLERRGAYGIERSGRPRAIHFHSSRM